MIKSRFCDLYIMRQKVALKGVISQKIENTCYEMSKSTMFGENNLPLIYLATKAARPPEDWYGLLRRHRIFPPNYNRKQCHSFQWKKVRYLGSKIFEIYAKMFIKYVRLNMASKDVRPNSIWRSKMDARCPAARTRELCDGKDKAQTHVLSKKMFSSQSCHTEINVENKIYSTACFLSINFIQEHYTI